MFLSFFRSVERLGRHVLHALQLARLQAGDARARLGHDAERHGVEAGLLVAAEAGALLVFRVRRIAVIALAASRSCPA